MTSFCSHPSHSRACSTALLLALTACATDMTTPPPTPHIAAISVSPPTSSLSSIDDTLRLIAVARDSQGTTLSNVVFAWASSQSLVATVDASGLAKARTNGVTTVSATAGGVSGHSDIQVQQVPAAVRISPASWSAPTIGSRQQFTASATDRHSHPVAQQRFTWHSSDSTAVRVDTTGMATALRASTDRVFAAAGAVMDSAAIAIAQPLGSGQGVMYTVWFARSDDAPALLVNGRIEVPDLYHDSVATPTSPWPSSTVAKFQWAGDRIGLLTDASGGLGTFRVTDRVGEWTNLALADASDFQLDGNRIGLLKAGGVFQVKDGIDGPWSVLVASGATQFQLAGDRIGVLDGAGGFRVKDGIAGAWSELVASGVSRFQVSGNRIGVLLDDGSFRVKDGIDGAWTEEVAAGGASGFDLSADRIAVLESDGTFLVKDGIAGTWTTLASGDIKQFDLEGNRIGLLFASGEFRVKDGIPGTWTILGASGIRAFQLQRDLIGMVTDAGILQVKTGIAGAWQSTAAYSGLTQFRLLVDVPVPPKRIMASAFDSIQTACQGDTLPHKDCYPAIESGLPVPVYGRYCGAGRPADADWAGRAGSTDGLDELCNHHDHVQTWYPESIGLGACVLRYGIYYGRLTKDGALLADGSSPSATWDAAWAQAHMDHLKEALDVYWGFTSGCALTLTAFTTNTASKN